MSNQSNNRGLAALAVPAAVAFVVAAAFSKPVSDHAGEVKVAPSCAQPTSWLYKGPNCGVK